MFSDTNPSLIDHDSRVLVMRFGPRAELLGTWTPIFSHWRARIYLNESKRKTHRQSLTCRGFINDELWTVLVVGRPDVKPKFLRKAGLLFMFISSASESRTILVRAKFRNRHYHVQTSFQQPQSQPQSLILSERTARVARFRRTTRRFGL